MRKVLLYGIILSVIFAFLVPEKAAAAPGPPSVVADGALLMDMDSGKILYEKNMDEKFYPASTTKIMTALLVLERCSLNDKVIIGKDPSSFVDGDKIYVYQGEEFTVDQLLHALLIASANDVAIALAEHVSGSVAEFAKLMNEKAAELGCKNTHFVNANGLDDSNHYTTAYDLSLITREAMKYETFRNIVATKSYAMPPTNKQPLVRYLNSNNRIMLYSRFHVDGADGIKVGYTTIAGHSFVGSATRNGMRLMVVLLHDKKPGLWEDAKSLLEYGFSSFKTVKEVSAGDYVSDMAVNGTSSHVPLVAANDLYYTFPSTETPDIRENVFAGNIFKGIILKGQIMGTVQYTANGDDAGSVALLADNDLPSTPLYGNKNGTDKNIKLIYSPWGMLPAAAILLFAALKINNVKRGI